jgi:carboxylesterase
MKDHSFRLEGGRTGVLLLHGLSGTPMELRYPSLALSRAGFTVYVPQLAGHCGTIEDLRASTWTDWATSAEVALMDLRRTCDRVVVGGLSMGSILALLLAQRNPNDVHGLALLAPTLKFDGWAVPWYAQLFNLVRDGWSADRFMFHEIEPYGIKDRRLREFVLRALQSNDSSTAGLPGTPGRSMYEFMKLVRHVRPRLGQIAQPTLIVHPREDDRASLDNMAILQRELSGPVHGVVLNDSYHVVTLDRQRDLVNESVVGFVERIAATAPAERKQQVAAGTPAKGAHHAIAS